MTSSHKPTTDTQQSHDTTHKGSLGTPPTHAPLATDTHTGGTFTPHTPPTPTNVTTDQWGAITGDVSMAFGPSTATATVTIPALEKIIHDDIFGASTENLLPVNPTTHVNHNLPTITSDQWNTVVNEIGTTPFTLNTLEHDILQVIGVTAPQHPPLHLI